HVLQGKGASYGDHRDHRQDQDRSEDEIGEPALSAERTEALSAAPHVVMTEDAGGEHPDCERKKEDGAETVRVGANLREPSGRFERRDGEDDAVARQVKLAASSGELGEVSEWHRRSVCG